MAVTYTADQRQAAKDKEQHLITMSIGDGALEFQGVVDEEERDALATHMLGFFTRRRAALKATAANATPH